MSLDGVDEIGIAVERFTSQCFDGDTLDGPIVTSRIRLSRQGLRRRRCIFLIRILVIFLVG
jgi:hypothetical protein